MQSREGIPLAKPATAATLRFSAIPSQNATEMVEKFDGFAKYLSGKLGIPVEYVHSVDYAASVEAFRQGKIHLAWFGGFTGVQARHLVPGSKAIAFGEEDPSFRSYFIAHQSTGIEPGEVFPAGIAKFAFCFGSKSSTSGRLMPEHFIRKHSGKTPKDFFTAEPFFSGSHPKTIELVASGQYPVGVVDYKEWEKAVDAKKVDPAVVRVIWKTPAYADYNFTVRADVDNVFGAGFTDKLQQVIVDCKDETLLKAFPRKSMIKAKNEDFDAIRQVAIDLKLIE